MGLGLIPVVGDIPGVREWVTPQAGYLFDLKRQDDLSEIIAHLIEHDADHDLMRRGNRERIEQKAVFEDNIAETISIMRGLCESNQEQVS
jgi:glycosyltransferase involved in cell wall biosynthesis